jgi:hypothetical protein
VARIVLPASFPLGVANLDAKLALCKALDELIVLRLDDGGVIWHARVDAQPLLVSDSLAIALCAGEVLAFSLNGTSADAPRWRVRLPIVPTEAEAVWMDGDVAVHWQSRERYRGGAHPGRRSSANTQSGQCCIAADTGAARPLAEWPEREEPAQWEASDDTSVLSGCVLGAARYRVSSAPGQGMNELTLVASRAADDSVIWQRPLGNATPRPAPRLRP